MEFKPTIGRTNRTFEHVWQVVRYETGYSAERMGLTDRNYDDAIYRMGRLDAREDAKTGTDAALRLRDRMEARKSMTFDQMLAEVSQ